MDILTIGFLVGGTCLAVFLFSIVVGIFNGLVQCKENVNKAWANIDVILKQRYDEIPQLIKICEQYIQFEQGMINRMMTARENMVRGNKVSDKIVASNELSRGINHLLAVGENYPDLKSNQNFLHIQKRLSSLEETLADRREFYNDSVNILNIRVQEFPDMFVANLLGIGRRDMFVIDEAHKTMPSLEINFKK